jgi:hypothetical protein
VTRPWCERPPPGYSLPLYAQAEGSGGRDGERRRPRRSHGRRAMVTHAVTLGAHAADSSRELVMWAAMPPRTWIHFPQFFSAEMPPRGPLELWLQHADCNAPTTGVEVEVISSGKIFMTRGWGEVARVCRTEGALAIHFEFDGASMMFFKVFDVEGHRLECCPGGGRQDGAAAGAGPAVCLTSGSSSSSSDAWESSDSPEPYETPEMSDDSYVPPSSHRARSKAAASGLRRR